MRKPAQVLAILVALGAVASTWLVLQHDAPPSFEPGDAVAMRGGGDEGPAVGLVGNAAQGAAALLEEHAGFTLLGRVVDDEGAPVAGVEVTIERPQVRRRDRDAAEQQLLEVRLGVLEHTVPVAQAVSDADGRFRVPGLEPETQYRCLLRPGPPWGWTDRTLRSDRRGLHEATYVLERGALLRGRVVDEHGEGLPATVIATRDPVNEDIHRTPAWSTGSDGRFEVAALPAGMWTFTINVADRGRRTGQMAVLPHDGELLLRWRYPEGPTLLGKVTDDSGRPVAGASVLVHAVSSRPEARGRWWALARSDATGGYRLDHLDPGLIQGITVEAEGFITIGDVHRNLLLGATGVVEVDFELARGCTIQGRVVDPTATPVPGAIVMLEHDMAFAHASGRTERRSTTSDAEGRFVFERLSPVGRVRLRAYTSEAASSPDGASLLVGGEARIVEQDLVLLEAPALRGVAIDAEGTPLEGIQVEATNHEVYWRRVAGLPTPSTTTDERGRFELRGILGGEAWSVDAYGAHLRMEAPLVVRVPALSASLQEVQLVLHPGAQLGGRVTDPEGRPLASCHLWLRPLQRRPGSRGVVVAHSNDRGEFVFARLAAGTYELPRGAFAGDAEAEEARTFDLQWGQVVEGVVVVRRPPLELSGVVLDADDVPLAGVQVRCRAAAADGRGDHDRIPLTASTDENGRFQASVGPGRYSLWVQGGEPVQDVEAGRTDIVLRGRRVSQVEVFGTIVDDRGRPVPRADVTVWVKNETGGRGGTHASCMSGTFRTSAPASSAPGDLFVSHATDAAGRPLDLAPGGITGVALADGPHVIRLAPGRAIEGRLVDAEGRGVPGIPVRTTIVPTDDLWWSRYASHGGAPTVTTDADGGFRIGGLAEAVHSVVVDAPAGWLRPSMQQVRAGQPPLEILMERCHVLAGRVVDSRGEPVPQAGVNVTWTSATGSAERAGAQTGADGTFHLAAVGAGPLRVEVSGSFGVTWPYKRFSQVGVQPDGAELVLQLESSVALSGVVVDADGLPANQASVWVRSLDREGPSRTQLLRCDAQGRFVASELEPGAYVLQARGGGRQAVAPDATVQVPATDVRLQLGRTWPIEGHVVGGGGIRYTLAFLYLDGSEVQSVGHGSFGTEPFQMWVPTQSAGTLWLSVEATGEYALIENVRPGSGVHRLVPKPGLELAGRVEDATRIRTRGQVVAADRRGIRARGEIRADGTFRVRGLPPGSYQLEAWLEREGGVARFLATDVTAGGSDVVMRAAK